MKVVRVISQNADFSDQYLAQFQQHTEELIRQATSKPVRLKLAECGA